MNQATTQLKKLKKNVSTNLINPCKPGIELNNYISNPELMNYKYRSGI